MVIAENHARVGGSLIELTERQNLETKNKENVRRRSRVAVCDSAGDTMRDGVL